MIDLKDYVWVGKEGKLQRVNAGIDGAALCFTIDSRVVHILPVDKSFADLLSSADEFIDLASEDSFIVGIKTGDVIEELLCSEIIYSILLSNPGLHVIESRHKYKDLVSIGWSYIDDEFVIPGEME
jgi:hypothetical protein